MRPRGDVNGLLGKLGIAGAIELAPAEIVAAAWEGKTVPIGSSTGLTLQRRRVNGESRLELNGFDPRSLPSLKAHGRSEEHTSELQSLMRISYAVFCLKKKNKQTKLQCTHPHRSR